MIDVNNGDNLYYSIIKKETNRSTPYINYHCLIWGQMLLITSEGTSLMSGSSCTTLCL